MCKMARSRRRGGVCRVSAHRSGTPSCVAILNIVVSLVSLIIQVSLVIRVISVGVSILIPLVSLGVLGALVSRPSQVSHV